MIVAGLGLWTVLYLPPPPPPTVRGISRSAEASLAQLVVRWERGGLRAGSGRARLLRAPRRADAVPPGARAAWARGARGRGRAAGLGGAAIWIG